MTGERTVNPTVGGAVARFALAGLVALAVVGVISFLVMRNTGTSEALKNARDLTAIVGEGIVEPNLTEGVVQGRPAALARFDRIVRRRVLRDPIVRVKIWTPSGHLAYSDKRRLTRGAGQARQGVRQLRGLLVEIYPPRLDEAGLGAAVSDLLAPLADRGIETDLDVSGDLRLSPQQEAALFRIAREAIRNAVKHGGATRLTVRAADEDSRVVLAVEDDGSGFAPEAAGGGVREGHLGLDLMRRSAEEAGAELEIASAPGEGTRVRVAIPMGER